MFDGTLGRWNTTLVNIELRSNSKLVNAKWYPVPRINKLMFKKELMRLVKIGVLERVKNLNGARLCSSYPRRKEWSVSLPTTEK